MANRIRDLWLRAIGLVDQGANQESKVVLTKRDDTQKMTEYSSMDECLKVHDEEKCKELMAAMKTQSAGTGQTVILDLTKAEERMPDNDVAKALAEAKAEAESVKKALADAQAEAKAAREAVAKMEDDRPRQIYIAKAKELTDLPGVNPDDFGPLLRKAHAGMTPEEQGKFDAVLRGAVKVAQDSLLFRELNPATGTAGGDAYAKLTAKANALIEKSAVPQPTFEQAFAKVSDTADGRKLLEEYEKERSDAARRVR